MIPLLARSPVFLILSVGVHLLGMTVFINFRAEMPSVALPKGTTILMVGHRPQLVFPKEADPVSEAVPEQVAEEPAPIHGKKLPFQPKVMAAKTTVPVTKPDIKPVKIEPPRPLPIVTPRQKPVNRTVALSTRQAEPPRPAERPELKAQAKVPDEGRIGTGSAQKAAPKEREILQPGSKESASAGNSAVNDYRAAVRARLTENKRYPRTARLRRVEGIVQISFTLLSDGEVADLKILASSGSSILDEEALKMVKRSSPFRPFPEHIGRANMKFAFPVKYSFE